MVHFLQTMALARILGATISTYGVFVGANYLSNWYVCRQFTAVDDIFNDGPCLSSFVFELTAFKAAQHDEP